MEGRHMHKKHYEHWRYRRSFGKIAKFDHVVNRYSKNTGNFRRIIRYFGYINSVRNYSGLKNTTYKEFYSQRNILFFPYYF